MRRPQAKSLDLGFLEFHVLLDHGVILFEHELFGAGARVLLSDVEEAGAGCRQQLDLLSDGLGHR